MKYLFSLSALVQLIGLTMTQKCPIDVQSTHVRVDFQTILLIDLHGKGPTQHHMLPTQLQQYFCCDSIINRTLKSVISLQV